MKIKMGARRKKTPQNWSLCQANNGFFGYTKQKLANLARFFVEPNRKVNEKYHCNELLKKVIPEMIMLVEQEYLFLLQDGARLHTVKPTLDFSKQEKRLRLLGPIFGSLIVQIGTQQILQCGEF